MPLPNGLLSQKIYLGNYPDRKWSMPQFLFGIKRVSVMY